MCVIGLQSPSFSCTIQSGSNTKMPEIDRLRSHVDQLRKEQGISREKVSVSAQRWESDHTRLRVVLSDG